MSVARHSAHKAMRGQDPGSSPYPEYSAEQVRPVKSVQTGRGAFEGGPLLRSPAVKSPEDAGAKSKQQRSTMLGKIRTMEKEIHRLEQEKKEATVHLKQVRKELHLEKKRREVIKDDNWQLKERIKHMQMVMLKARLGGTDKPITYEVRENDSLWRIAKKDEVYDNPYKWLELYHANKEKLDNPNRIYPGQVLVIPRYE